MPEPLRVILIGAGTRARDFYVSLCQTLKDDLGIELVGVWSRSEGKARALAEPCRVLWQADLEQLVRQTEPHLAIVSVNSQANGSVAKQVLELGLHALLETPIAHELCEADDIIAIANAKGLKVEVAEQCYRWPMQRIRLKLVKAGLFSRVFTVYNDFLSNGYHGVSLIRAYLGFDNPVVRVQAASAKFTTAPHYAWFTGETDPREEVWQHGILHFADGRLGHAHFTNIWYDSALRWQRSMRFFAERGMASGDELTTLSSDGKHPQPIRLERRTQYVRADHGSGYSLTEIVAHSDPLVVWRNPFAGHLLDDDHIAVADYLMNQPSCATSCKPSSRGFRAIKMGWRPFGRMSRQLDAQLVKIAHETVGPEVELMVDAGGSEQFWPHNYKWAAETARMLKDYDVTWFEEALPPDDIEGFIKLREHAPLLIASGEVLTRRQTFMPWIERGR